MVSEQRNTEERDFRFCPREKWYENPIFRAVFDSPAFLVLCSETARKRLLRRLGDNLSKVELGKVVEKRVLTQLQIEPARCEHSENSEN